MSDRIDHAANARVLEQNAWAKGGPDGEAFIRTHEQRQDMILSAQVHATLALVEQQRIANLIALGTARIAPDQVPPLRALVFEAMNEYDLRPTLAIREALA